MRWKQARPFEATAPSMQPGGAGSAGSCSGRAVAQGRLRACCAILPGAALRATITTTISAAVM